MSETLEQVAFRLWDEACSSKFETDLHYVAVRFAELLTEELCKQETFVVTQYDPLTSPDNGVWLEGADKAHFFPYGAKLYAAPAPVIPADQLAEARKQERERCAFTVERLIVGDGICASDEVWIHDCAEAIRTLKDE